MRITLVKFVIAVEPGWSVGSADRAFPAVDEDLLTDAAGRPWVPASSLAGSLRGHLARHDMDERLMGSRTDADELRPSKLWFLGTRLVGETETAVVASTAIDPTRKGAQPKSLRHARVVETPTTVELYGMCEARLTETELTLLASWQPSVGGNRSTGGGRSVLRSFAYRVFDLDRDDDLRAWLTTTGPERYTGMTDIPVVTSPEEPLLDVRFRIVDALHIGTGSREGHMNLILRRNGVPLVPGRSWKGVFRSRAGFILRTLGGEGCISQQECRKRDLCDLCKLFGSATARGRLMFVDSPIENAVTERRSHVAIDRVTGGARDKQLFDREVVTSGEISLQIMPLGQVEEWHRTLLWHVVRDLDDGLIGIGGGTQRGSGTLQLTTPLHRLEPVVVS